MYLEHGMEGQREGAFPSPLRGGGGGGGGNVLMPSSYHWPKTLP